MVRFSGILTLIAGVIMVISGATTWMVVSNQLEAENIVVAEDAQMNAGAVVNGPLDAWSQADVIATHTLEATGGLTYAELEREDPVRAVAQAGAFLRASLFTSVVAFGVAALVVGLGIVFIPLGLALMALGATAATASKELQEPAVASV